MKEQHKRRVRYKGTHPRNFQEKYKELNPQKYSETVNRVISKGNTPAGMHRSIMVHEILDVLNIQSGEQGLDCTLGYGGHTLEMLKLLGHSGKMYALDIDTIEMQKTRVRLSEKGYGEEDITILHQNFANIDLVAQQAGKFDFVLADLGVSSMQIDNPERGFSYKLDGPLDLRLNPEQDLTAAQRLLEITKDEFEGMLQENADEPYAEQIAETVMNAIRKGQPVDTTTKLRQLIEQAFLKIRIENKEEAVKKSCQRTFQALRIDINSEYEVLETFLEKLPGILKPGGRAAILTFHSGEDRLVKRAFREGKRTGIYSDISAEAIRPSMEECRANSRAHSTKLRWSIRSSE